MYLLIPNADALRSPSQADVIAAIKAIDHESYTPFVILVNERKENSFFQIRRNSARLYEAEYAEGLPQRQYRTVKLSRARVLEMIVAYLERNDSFKQMSPWVEISDSIDLPQYYDIEEEHINNEQDHINMNTPEKAATLLAIEIASTISNAGYQADNSLESLAEIDRLIDEHSQNGKANKGGLLAPESLPPAQRTQVRLFSLGCYVGEVLCNLLDGRWDRHAEHPDRPELWQVTLPSGSTFYPINKVFKRFANGEEDNLYNFGAVVVGLEQTGNPGA